MNAALANAPEGRDDTPERHAFDTIKGSDYLADQSAAIEMCQSDGTLLYDAERAVMGYDHAAVGQALLSSWNLPATLQEPVAHHHRPLRASRFQVEVSVVHVADILAHALLMGSSGERLVPPLNAEGWDRMGIAESSLAEILNEIDQHYTVAVRTILEDSE